MNQHNKYCLVKDGFPWREVFFPVWFFPAADSSTTLDHREFVNCIFLSLRFIFNFSGPVPPSHEVTKLLGVFFLWGADDLSCTSLFHSPVTFVWFQSIPLSPIKSFDFPKYTITIFSPSNIVESLNSFEGIF